jgi:ribosomal protein S18 acetylase RimI-like enzyme
MTGVVQQCRRMAGNYDLHLLTLPQVASLLRVEGAWPGALTLKAGWFRARARPWNEVVTAPMVRLERGGAEFLIAARDQLIEITGRDIYSPALYPGSTRVWKRAGFDRHAELTVMERPLGEVPGGNEARLRVSVEPAPEWEGILEVDRAAFEGFWGMGRLGLEEALQTNPATTLLIVSGDGQPDGYAIVGSQWGVAYLHRIAVRPERAGQGLGRALVESAIEWGSAHGAKSMVLNVRDDNRQALSLYRRSGFTDTGTRLQILRHPAR